MISMPATVALNDNGIGVVLFICLVVLVLALYWAPLALAYRRRSPDLVAVAVVNGLLGWTVAGWIVALAMALRPGRRFRHGS
jgi:Mn2+/Fe2+ NRAMP family transporter